MYSAEARELATWWVEIPGFTGAAYLHK